VQFGTSFITVHIFIAPYLAFNIIFDIITFKGVLMCADRMRSIVIAIILGASLGLLGSGNVQYLFIVQVVIVVALLVDGFTGFCPIRVFLRTILPKCEDR
jgi:hypothetical protein